MEYLVLMAVLRGRNGHRVAHRETANVTFATLAYTSNLAIQGVVTYHSPEWRSTPPLACAVFNDISFLRQTNTLFTSCTRLSTSADKCRCRRREIALVRLLLEELSRFQAARKLPSTPLGREKRRENSDWRYDNSR